jgi:cell division protein FtsB
MTAAALVNLGVPAVLADYLAAQYAALEARVAALESA